MRLFLFGGIFSALAMVDGRYMGCFSHCTRLVLRFFE